MIASIISLIVIFSIFSYWSFYLQSPYAKIVMPVAIFFAFAIFILKYIGERSINKFLMFENGRKGEYAVCDELEKLPEEYSIFRNIRFENRGDIDLVVSGPTGVFAIEVKSHKGNIFFNFKDQQLERNHKTLEKNFIGQARAGALSLKTFLSQGVEMRDLFIDALLVFSDEKTKLCFSSVVAPNIQIIKRESLNDVILSSCVKLTEAQLLVMNGKLLELVR